MIDFARKRAGEIANLAVGDLVSISVKDCDPRALDEARMPAMVHAVIAAVGTGFNKYILKTAAGIVQRNDDDSQPRLFQADEVCSMRHPAPPGETGGFAGFKHLIESITAASTEPVTLRKAFFDWCAIEIDRPSKICNCTTGCTNKKCICKYEDIICSSKCHKKSGRDACKNRSCIQKPWKKVQKSAEKEAAAAAEAAAGPAEPEAEAGPSNAK
eukprot:tig00021463_g21622.t1